MLGGLGGAVAEPLGERLPTRMRPDRPPGRVRGLRHERGAAREVRPDPAARCRPGGLIPCRAARLTGRAPIGSQDQGRTSPRPGLARRPPRRAVVAGSAHDRSAAACPGAGPAAHGHRALEPLVQQEVGSPAAAAAGLADHRVPLVPLELAQTIREPLDRDVTAPGRCPLRNSESSRTSRIRMDPSLRRASSSARSTSGVPNWRRNENTGSSSRQSPGGARQRPRGPKDSRTRR